MSLCFFNRRFLKDFLPQINLPVYLETNSTLSDKLSEVIEYIEYVSADIKLPSCSGLPSLWNEHDKFFQVASQKELFAKVVFDNKINDIEIVKTCNLAKKYGVELILQPILNKFLKQYKNTRLIPQVHKFLNVN